MHKIPIIPQQNYQIISKQQKSPQVTQLKQTNL
jgi:hypothetical protein